MTFDENEVRAVRWVERAEVVELVHGQRCATAIR